jgi:hypothetical protein
MELWYIIHAINKLLPLNVISRWVKGHQDKQTKFEELEFDAQLNALADTAAEQQYITNDPFRETPHLNHGGVIYYRDSHPREIANTYKFIQQAYHGYKLRAYIQKMQEWTEITSKRHSVQ